MRYSSLRRSFDYGDADHGVLNHIFGKDSPSSRYVTHCGGRGIADSRNKFFP